MAISAHLAQAQAAASHADLVAEACARGESFREHYYRVFDQQRQLLVRFYADESSVVWNGNRVQGKLALEAMFNALPVSSHHVQTLDVQPYALPDPRLQAAALLSVNGTVRFGDEYPRPFVQSVLLVQNAQGTAYVLNDCYRVLH